MADNEEQGPPAAPAAAPAAAADADADAEAPSDASADAPTKDICADAPPADAAPAPKPAALPEQVQVCGIDLGADTSVVATCSTRTLKCDISRNDLSNQKTPMVVSYAGGYRSVGELAVQLQTAHRTKTFGSLIRRLDFAHREESGRNEMQWLCTPAHPEETVSLDGVAGSPAMDLSLRAEELLSTLLRRLERFGRGEGKGSDGSVADSAPVSLVIPESFTATHCQAIRDAAKLAGLDLRLLVTAGQAAAMEYASKRPLETLKGTAVLIIDVGHAYTSAAVYEFSDGDKKKAVRVAAGCEEGLGGESVELAIYNELVEERKEKGQVIAPGSKGSLRLLTQVRKLKETLSAVGEGNVTVESLFEDQDIRFSYTRDRLESACAPVAERLEAFAAKVLAQCSEQVREKIKSCELIGGGMRIPFVKQAISNALGQDITLGYTMDSMAAPAIGAALACAQLFKPTGGGVQRPIFDTLPALSVDASAEPGLAAGLEAAKQDGHSEWVAQALEKETKLAAVDAAYKELVDSKNRLEARLFEIRALVDSRAEHSELVDKELCSGAANKIEEWLYDWEEDGGSNPGATAKQYQEKLEQFEQELAPACEKYNAKKAQEKLEAEKEMEEIAKAEAEARAAEGHDDHDNRRLKKADRLHKVNINKEEGTSLFKDGNIDAALERYLRALQHCEKLDLSPDLVDEDKEHKKALMISLQLNIAQANLKLKKFKEASKWAQKVLELDQEQPKALFRLAYAQENLKQFEQAKKNLLSAQKLAPTDKAIAQLLNRVNVQIKREQERKKKMAQKMFG